MAGDAQFDLRMMHRALALAARGEGFVEPNPMVGCVVVRHGQVVGEGWHERFGGDHAEVAALRRAGDAAKGATLYVTLEPCCHQGKTPPCTEAILQAQVSRVVAAHLDPFPHVAGKGAARLQAAGIKFDEGIGAREAAELLAPYLKRVRQGLPWVIAKWAMTWDGKLAAAGGDSRWISNESSRRVAHRLRGRVDAILVGRGTAESDDPLLTARPAGPRTALRVVLDSQASLAPHTRLVQTAREVPVLVACSPSAPPAHVARLQAAGCEVWEGSENPAKRLGELLEQLALRGATNVLVEGGSILLGALFDAKLVDEVHVFLAPKIAGGQSAPSPVGGRGQSPMARACRLVHFSYEMIDGDLYAHGRILRNADASPPAAPRDAGRTNGDENH